jgi:Zn finger protein HypA/HybF involved in hydrogenase expression
MKQALEAMETNQYTVAELAPHRDVMKFNNAITALRTALEQPEQECWCHKCNENRLVNNIPFSATRMILCPTCGNKRCPKASDHRLDCTDSNEPNQPGSLYTTPPAAQRKPLTCAWWPENDDLMPGTYSSACGELWSFIDGGWKENNVRFCHGCGGKVVESTNIKEAV